MPFSELSRQAENATRLLLRLLQHSPAVILTQNALWLVRRAKRLAWLPERKKSSPTLLRVIRKSNNLLPKEYWTAAKCGLDRNGAKQTLDIVGLS